MVANNAWVPLFKRLTRLARVMLARWRDEGVVSKSDKLYPDKLIRAVRSAAPEMDTMPPPVRDWVLDVRARIGVKDGVYVFDDHGIKVLKFDEVCRVNLWLQQEFRRLGVRGTKLMPVAGVGTGLPRVTGQWNTAGVSASC